MILKEGEGVNSQLEVILKIVAEVKKIVADIDAEKVDLLSSRIYLDAGVHVEIVPDGEKAMGVYICIRGMDDIVVGILCGAHEHFNSSDPVTEIVEKALDFFKALLYSKQIINLKLKDGEIFSKEVLFKLNNDLVSEYSDRELILNIFGEVISESHEFSFI